MTKKQTLEIAYELNYQMMMRARPGSRRHQYFVRREVELHYELKHTNAYRSDPCRLYNKESKSCEACTGWIGRGMRKINNKMYKGNVQFPVGKGYKCKMK